MKTSPPERARPIMAGNVWAASAAEMCDSMSIIVADLARSAIPLITLEHASLLGTTRSVRPLANANRRRQPIAGKVRMTRRLPHGDEIGPALVLLRKAP